MGNRIRFLLAFTNLLVFMTFSISACTALIKGGFEPLIDDHAQIAVEYTNDLYSGKLEAARLFVFPADRPTFDLISAIIRGNQVRARDISVGSYKKYKETAEVILEGTFCVGGSNKSQGKQSVASTPECFTNKDPESPNQAVHVKLIKSKDNSWFVYFPIPK